MIPQALNAQIEQSSSNFVIIVTDRRISRIEKNIVQNGPKLLNLYTSIYGNHIFLKFKDKLDLEKMHL